jgi:hypothetical protein
VRELQTDTVRSILARAGVPGAGLAAGGSRADAAVLVLHGRWRKSLAIYDASGYEIGTAVRTRDKYRDVGARYHYDISDTALRCVVRDVTPRHRGIAARRPEFSVLGPDGRALGTIRRESGLHNYAVDAGGAARASIRRVGWRKAANARPQFAFTDVPRRWRWIDRLSSRVWYLLTDSNRPIARITHLFANGNEVTYVLEREQSIGEPMRTLALALVIVVDNRITTDSNSG